MLGVGVWEFESRYFKCPLRILGISLDPPTEGFEPKLWGCIGAVKIQGELTVWLVVDYLGEVFFWRMWKFGTMMKILEESGVAGKMDSLARRNHFGLGFFFPRWWWFSHGIFLKINH